MSYAKLTDGFRKIALLRESMAVLEWDSAVLMPEAAAERRGQQVAILESVAYEHLEEMAKIIAANDCPNDCLLYTSPSPRDGLLSRMPSSA